MYASVCARAGREIGSVSLESKKTKGCDGQSGHPEQLGLKGLKLETSFVPKTTFRLLQLEGVVGWFHKSNIESSMLVTCAEKGLALRTARTVIYATGL